MVSGTEAEANDCDVNVVANFCFSLFMFSNRSSRKGLRKHCLI